MAARARLAELARLREAAYRLLALLFLYPEQGTLAAAPQAARHLRAHSHGAAAFAFHQPLSVLLSRGTGLTPARLGALQESYGRLFIPSSDRDAVPLCESAYADPGVGSGQAIAQIAWEYARVGLAAAPGGEGPDHISSELEFVSFLCGREAEAWDQGLSARALDAAGEQSKFLERHPCRWLPSLVAAVEAVEATSLYATAARAAQAMVAHDADFQRALVGHLAGDIRESQEMLHA